MPIPCCSGKRIGQKHLFPWYNGDYFHNEGYFRRERIPIFTVLLVDDEPLVLEGLAFMIDWESHGFRICGEACDGEEALNRIQELSPDLVVLDISMPVMDGLQLVEHCTKVLNVPCRFIILSGHDDFAFAQKAMTCGVLDYWLKPIDVEEINATLGKLSKEWSHPGREEAGSPPAALPLAAAWTVLDADDPLFAAEDSLLLAIQAGDGTAIDEAAGRLCSQMELSFRGDREASKAFLSNVLLELIWKVMEGEMTSPAPDDEHALSLPVLPNRPERWPDILASFARETVEQLTRQKAMTGPVGEAARIIRERYREPLQLQAVAKMLHFQPAYLGQLFKKQTGMSFLDYVHRTRIEASRRLLRRTDLKIADVARTVGYADPEQFAAKFKQWMDMPPSQYKNG
ncbi:YesN/AraC family two-component response regulator [Cohnella phaseoli]|uniref:YesN/AraC family two-component response regulator n=1 Tax=Cohnella phaseoli TaxID=456490 RepID=A0A3D9INY6_9BACL|nr:YesN/AraC family two-component response regulator [Cohnella phaseoli]